jgi:hypothetical protein
MVDQEGERGIPQPDRLVRQAPQVKVIMVIQVETEPEVAEGLVGLAELEDYHPKMEVLAVLVLHLQSQDHPLQEPEGEEAAVTITVEQVDQVVEEMAVLAPEEAEEVLERQEPQTQGQAEEGAVTTTMTEVLVAQEQ